MPSHRFTTPLYYPTAKEGRDTEALCGSLARRRLDKAVFAIADEPTLLMTAFDFIKDYWWILLITVPALAILIKLAYHHLAGRNARGEQRRRS